MKIAIGSDHRGYELKVQLLDKLIENGFECVDYGCFSNERCDYPVFAFKVGEAVSKKECSYGVVICGSGDGVCIATNKVKGIRCSCHQNSEDVVRAKAHDNINVLAIAAEKTSVIEAIQMINSLVNTQFLNGRYQERINMIEEYENNK